MILAWIAMSVGVWAPTDQEPTDRKVEGILVFAKDASSQKRIEDKFRPRMDFSQFTLSLKDEPVIVEPWGRRSAIVIDKGIGPLLRRQEKNRVLQVLDTMLKDDYTIDLASLSPEDRQAFLRQTPGIHIDPEAGSAPLIMGFELSTSVELAVPAQGPVVGPSLLPDRGAREKMVDALRRTPFPLWRPQSQEDRDKSLERTKEIERLHGRFVVSTRGISGDLLDEGLEQAAKVVTKLQQDLQREQDALVRKLAKRFQGGPGLPSEVGSLGNLPEAMKLELEKSFGDAYEYYGFGSKEDALRHLRQASDIRVFTKLKLQFGIAPSGPGRSASGGGFTFVTFPGTP